MVMAWLQQMGLRRQPGIIEAWHTKRRLSYRSTGAYEVRDTWDDITGLSDSVFCHAHVCAAEASKLAQFRVITIFRDPRNVLVSFARWKERSLVEALDVFFGAEFVKVYRGFLGWRGRSLCLRYEDFPAGFAGDGKGLYRHASKDHNTWTGEPSDWRKVWNDEIDHAWRAAGGWFLVRDAGYA